MSTNDRTVITVQDLKIKMKFRYVLKFIATATVRVSTLLSVLMIEERKELSEANFSKKVIYQNYYRTNFVDGKKMKRGEENCNKFAD